MTTAKFDNLWILMSKYTFDIDSDTIYEDLKCVICKKIMIDSYQSECGCQYCYKCIKEYLNAGNQYCPGMKDECKEECLSLDGNLFRNTILNKKVSKLKVHCPNESCELKDELIKMEGHLLLCMKKEIKCPYAALGCDNKSENKFKIMSHLNKDTIKHNHLTLKYIQNIKNEFTDLKESSNDIDNMKMEIITLKNELEVTKFEIISLKEDLSIVKEKQNNPDLDSVIDIVKSGDIANDQTKKLILREIFDFVWIIKDFSEKAKSKISYFSEPFYKNKYKLCLRISFKSIYVNSKSLEGMSVYGYISRQNTDETTEWPLKNKIVVSIFNPRIWETFKSWDYLYDTYTSGSKSVFTKPEKWDEKSRIYFGDISLSSMIRKEAIFEDSVIIGFNFYS